MGDKKAILKFGGMSWPGAGWPGAGCGGHGAVGQLSLLCREQPGITGTDMLWE